MTDEQFDELDRRFDDFANRATSIRSHFVGFLCFWSIYMLSISFWKAALVGFFATCFMIFEVERRLVTLAVFGLTLAGSASFFGVTIYDVKQMAIDFHLASN
jgi:hypothetical protein